MKRFIALPLVLSGFISACTTGSPIQPISAEMNQYLASEIAKNNAERASCVDQRDDPRFASVKSRVATDTPPTVAQLADTGKPNSAERARLIEWGTLLSYCRDKGFGPQPGYPWEQFQVAIASLAAGEVTYGTHNRRIVELLAISKAHADAEQQRIAAQRAIEQAQADAAAGAALGAGLDMFLAGQQIRTLRGR